MRTIILTLLLMTSLTTHAALLPQQEGERERYNVQIDLGRAYISGICLMLREGHEVKGSIMNEFGVSYLDYTYDTTTHKVRLVSVTAKLDRWYIRRMLRRDLRHLMQNLAQGTTQYKRWRLTPLEE